MEKLGKRVTAACMPRVALKETSDRKVKPLKKTMFFECLYSIFRARRIEATVALSEGANGPLIETNQENKKIFHCRKPLIRFY